jgi:hypothetical protein
MASSLLLPAFLLQGPGTLRDLAHQALEAFALFFPTGFGSHSRPPCAFFWAGSFRILPSAPPSQSDGRRVFSRHAFILTIPFREFVLSARQAHEKEGRYSP